MPQMTTEIDLRKGFLLGHWEVLPDRGLLRDEENSEHLEPLVMRVLVALAAAQGEVLSKDELIKIAWDGRALSDEPLNRCISLLRRKLGDDSRNPTYIQNIPRLGYRLMIPIQVPNSTSPTDERRTTRRPGRIGWAAGALAILAAMVAIGVRNLAEPDAGRAGMRSVAIYPFSCTGVTEEYLCFGFSEELTSTLLHTAQIKIVKFREPLPVDRSPLEIARSLGVDGLLTGSVQQIGDRLRISAELIDGDDGFVILSDKLDGSVSDVFGLQEQVASVVEHAILGTNGEPVRSASRPANSEAFVAYGQGQYQFDRRTRAAVEESIRLFKETIRLDPMFGPAYLRLAYAYLLLPEYDSSQSFQSMYDLAAETANAGIAADPEIRETAGTVFGFIHHKCGEQAPDNAAIISRLAITNLWVSDLGAAGKYFDIANGMGQESPIHDLAYALYLIRMEDVAAARRFTKTGLAKYGLESSWVDPVYDGLGNPESRTQSVALVSKLEVDGSLAKYMIMTLWATLGEADRAFETVVSTNEIGQDFETGLEVMFSDNLEILRQHREFPSLLESTGLTEYWAQIGCRWVNDRVQCE